MTLSDVLKEPENMIEEFFGTPITDIHKRQFENYKTKLHNCVKIDNNYMDYEDARLYAIWYAITNDHLNVVIGAPNKSGLQSIFRTVKSYIKHIVKRLNEMKDNFISITAEGENFVVLSNGSCISSNTMLDDCIFGPSYDLVLYIGLDEMTDDQYKQFTMCYIPVICNSKKTKVIFMYEKNNREIFDKLT